LPLYKTHTTQRLRLPKQNTEYQRLQKHPRCDWFKPLETGIGGVCNKKVTSKRAYKYQRRDWESGLSCRRQQVSGKSQDTWSP